MSFKTCSECGNLIPEDTVNCPYCAVKEDNTKIVEQGLQQPETIQPEITQTKKKKSKIWIVILVIFIILAIAAGVTYVLLNNLVVKETKVYLGYGETKQLDYKGIGITWTSDDNSVATVNDGVITGGKEGSTVITAKTITGKKVKVEVVTSVLFGKWKSEGVMIDKDFTSFTMFKMEVEGDKFTFSAPDDLDEFVSNGTWKFLKEESDADTLYFIFDGQTSYVGLYDMEMEVLSMAPTTDVMIIMSK